MRVFVAGPEQNDTFAHNIIHSFRGMGYEVAGLSASSGGFLETSLGRGTDFLLGGVSRQWRQRRDSATLQAAKRFKPDLIVVGTRTLDPESIAAMRKASGAKVVCWYTDPPANLHRNHIVSGEYDAVFMKDSAFAGRLRKLLGLNVHHLDEACNPDWHRPVSGRRNDAVIVAGSLYGLRGAVASRLADRGYGVKIYGPKPPLWVASRISALHTGEYLNHNNKARVFGEAMACLNTFAPAEGDSLNCRVFESCGCGALLLSEKREAINRCFEPGREYLAFDSFDECVGHLDRLRTDPAFGNEVRDQAAKRAHAQHTYRHRLEKILEVIDMA